SGRAGRQALAELGDDVIGDLRRRHLPALERDDLAVIEPQLIRAQLDERRAARLRILVVARDRDLERADDRRRVDGGFLFLGLPAGDEGEGDRERRKCALHGGANIPPPSAVREARSWSDVLSPVL